MTDLETGVAAEIRHRCGRLAQVIECRGFAAARTALLRDPPALLVTNLRLRGYNGLHLVYLARARGFVTRSVVFADPLDVVLATEAQRIGAFVERPHRVARAVISYVSAALPPRDRRDPTVYDRRRISRGGRRASDLPPTWRADVQTHDRKT